MSRVYEIPDGRTQAEIERELFRAIVLSAYHHPGGIAVAAAGPAAQAFLKEPER